MADFFKLELSKYSILEAMKQIFMLRNVSFIDPYKQKKKKKGEIVNYDLGNLACISH